VHVKKLYTYYVGVSLAARGLPGSLQHNNIRACYTEQVKSGEEE